MERPETYTEKSSKKSSLNHFPVRQLQVNNREILLVEVPEWAYFYSINDFDGHKYLSILNKRNTQSWDLPDQLPFPGSWELLGRGDQLTEEQWKGIAEVWGQSIKHTSYCDYTDEGAGTSTATESGHSLLKANVFKPETVIVLIKDI